MAGSESGSGIQRSAAATHVPKAWCSVERKWRGAPPAAMDHSWTVIRDYELDADDHELDADDQLGAAPMESSHMLLW